MDPVSVCSGVAGLVALLITVTEISHRYVSNVHGSTRTILNFVQELAALKGVLVRLQHVTEKEGLLGKSLDQSDFPLSELPIASCQFELEIIRGKLLKRLSGGTVSMKIGSLMWPFAEQETRRQIDRLQNWRAIFNTAVTTELLSVVISASII